jgi:acetyl-CoA carboxylase biotin carboxyl carrier protein
MNEKTILALIDKFDAASIAEMDLNDGTVHLILRKESVFAAGNSGVPPKAGTAGQSSGAEGPVRLGIPVNRPEGEAITSPIVASFYASPSPDAPPYAGPGTKVKAGDTLCILEAMKMMNHLEAEFDCEIIKIHVSSGDMVEYGQTLFTVKRL